MRAMDPAAGPESTFGDGYFVSHDHLPGGRIAAHLQLDAHSSHLIFGGVGSGKTTQLYWTREQLKNAGVPAGYVDLPSTYDFSQPQQGLLLAAAGFLASNLPSLPKSDAKSEVIRLSRGAWEEYDPYDYDDRDYDHEPPQRFVPGLLRPVKRWSSTSAFRQALTEMLQEASPPPVLLLDGLDRLPRTSGPGPILDALDRMIQEDLADLMRAGLGIALTAPLALHWVWNQAIDDRPVGQTYFVRPPLDDEDFLLAVLDRRCSDLELFPTSRRKELVAYAGGLLRDLVLLCREAMVESFRSGASQVTEESVTVVAQRLGQSLLHRLPTSLTERLKKHRLWRQDDPTEEDLVLLSRRVLVESHNGSLVVHPAIRRLWKNH